MWKYSEKNLGEFVEEDGGNTFTYKETEGYNPYNLPHQIDVLDGTRFAIVKKTVAYIAIDEDADGNPVLEKWFIKQHKQYR